MFPTEQAERAIIHLERGIALSQVGQEKEAREAFDRALSDARAEPGSWEQRLHRRMLKLEDHRALALWVSVLGSAQ